MPVKIIVDSSVDLDPAVREKITAVVPLSVTFGTEEYQDDVTITPQQFYERLASAAQLPTTSQPTPAAFEAAYEKATADGSQVVVITIASQLSGTYQSATIAAADYPDRVFVADSRNAAIGAGVLAMYALQLAEQGMTAPRILEELISARKRICLYAMVDTLDYLKKGGRLPAAAAVMGGLLNVKPLIRVEEGKIHVQTMARGLKKAFAALTDLSVAADVDTTMPSLLGYSGTDENLRKYRDSQDFWDPSVPETVVGAAIGTHAGPGAVAAAFFRK